MDAPPFDRLSRFFAAARSHRTLGGALLGSVAAVIGLGEAAAACPPSKKRCRKKCIPKKSCCTNANCRPGVTGKVCRRGRCVCPPSAKPCGNRCIPLAACCPTCPSGQVCQAGACCYATADALRTALGPGGPALIRLCPDTTFQGPFTITRSVTVLGAGANSTILDGGRRWCGSGRVGRRWTYATCRSRTGTTGRGRELRMEPWRSP